MYHFVNPVDIIPAACFIQDFLPHAKKKLGWLYELMLSSAQNQQDPFFRNVVNELNERNKAPHPLVAKNKPEVCIPIGKYLIFSRGQTLRLSR